MGGASGVAGVAAAPRALAFATPAAIPTQNFIFLKCHLGLSILAVHVVSMTQHK